MNECEVVGCTQNASKFGYTMCDTHIRLDKAGKLHRCLTCNRLHDGFGAVCIGCSDGSAQVETEADPHLLTSAALGDHFGVSATRMALILAELGWIERHIRGWMATDYGSALGAQARHLTDGKTFVVWPPTLQQNAVLLAAIAEAGSASADARPSPSAKADPTSAPTSVRALDGHRVRSSAEALIDNWLYLQNLPHAYDRRLPIAEDARCTFYLPGGKGVYLEYHDWATDPTARDRHNAKRAIYAKYGLQVVELSEEDIDRLDEVLPGMLAKFGVESA